MGSKRIRGKVAQAGDKIVLKDGAADQTTLQKGSNTGPATHTLPASDSILVGRDTTDTLTNKTLTSPDINGGTVDGAVIGGNSAAAGTFTDLTASGTVTLGGSAAVTRTSTDTGANRLQNKDLSDDSVKFVDEADTTKALDVSLGGATTATKTTLAASQTANRTITFPDATDTLVGKATTDTLTNKTFDVDGTGNSLTNVANANIKASAAIAHSKLADITAGSVLLGNVSNVPTATALSGDVTVNSSGVTAISAGVIVNADINASAAIADTKLDTITTAGKVSNSATTATDANIANAIVARDASGNFSAGTITATLYGTATNVSGTVAIANGGTGQTSQTAAFDALAPTTTKGDVIAYNGTDNIRVAVGADGQVLTADSAQASGLTWTSPLTNPMDAAGQLIYGGASGTATKLAAGTSGQILTSSGASAPSWSDTFSTDKTFSGQVRIADGTVADPSLLFTSDDDGTGTGIYRVGANSMGFAANGVNIGQYSSTGLWRLGPTAGVSGTMQSTASAMLVGGDDLHAGGCFLIIGRRSSGTKVAYIAAGSGSECGMEFASRDSGNAYLNVGGYSSAGAWTFGNGTGEVHRFNCQTNAAAPGAVSTYMRINVNGTTYKVALLGNT